MVKSKEWVEAAWDNFHEAVSLGNIRFAQDVIKDTREAGFPFHAQRMADELKAHK